MNLKAEATHPVASRKGSQTQPEYPVLSVIVPAFNEHATLHRVIDTVLRLPISLEMIIVDDGSTDGTTDLMKSLPQREEVITLFHAVNKGKGAAIRTGLEQARGEFTIIQDADLEYNPEEFPALLAPLRSGEADVVYGSRYLQKSEGSGFRLFRYGVSLLNVVAWLLYGCRLSDSATCYKAAPTKLLKSLNLECERFEFCPEVTSKLCRLGISITEIPVSYQPRSASEGKKIRMRDGWEALTTLWKYRNWKPQQT